jgi:hypothetical protein
MSQQGHTGERAQHLPLQPGGEKAGGNNGYGVDRTGIHAN